jgi:hypothetical protein
MITKELLMAAPHVTVNIPKEEFIKIEDVPEPDFDMKYKIIGVPLYKYITRLVRTTYEYKEFIYFLKNFLDVDHCSYYEGYSIKNGFTIEIHHSPFTLFDICEVVAQKQYKENDGYIETFKVCEEVTRLHYEFKVGLVPLNPTAHELVHSDAIKIHPKLLLNDGWKTFEKEYREFMSEDLMSKYLETVKYEDDHDYKQFPKILERKEIKLDVPKFKSLQSIDLNKLVVQNKMKLLEESDKHD